MRCRVLKSETFDHAWSSDPISLRERTRRPEVWHNPAAVGVLSLQPGDLISMRGNKCSDVMTSDLTCCLPDDTVHVVAQSMKTQDVGAMPVIDSHNEKRLIGIVTDRDLALKVVAENRDARKTKVEDVMSRKMVVCKTGDSWQIALDAMAKHQLRRIPVVDQEGRLAGIIAQADVATRIEQPAATAKVVEEISRAA